MTVNGDHDEHRERVDKALKRVRRWTWGERIVVGMFCIGFVAAMVVAAVSITLDVQQRDNNDIAVETAAASACRTKLTALTLSHALVALTAPAVPPTASPEAVAASKRGREVAAGLDDAHRVFDDTCATPAGRALVDAIAERH